MQLSPDWELIGITELGIGGAGMSEGSGIRKKLRKSESRVLLGLVGVSGRAF